MNLTEPKQKGRKFNCDVTCLEMNMVNWCHNRDGPPPRIVGCLWRAILMSTSSQSNAIGITRGPLASMHLYSFLVKHRFQTLLDSSL